MPWASERVLRRFQELLAELLPFDLVIDEETAWGEKRRVSKSSVCGSWGAVAGTLRFFADRFGVPRASIEGTRLPPDVVRAHAVRAEPELVYDARRRALVLSRRLEFFGFELERETEVLQSWDDETAPQATRVLAEALARGDARHTAVRRNLDAIEAVREVWRRSGGRTARLNMHDLAGRYAEQLHDVRSLDDFRARPTAPRPRRAGLGRGARALARPADGDRRARARGGAGLRGGGGRGRRAVRRRAPAAAEKLARTHRREELPVLDRPRALPRHARPRGAVRADTLDELQELLDRPWTPEESERTPDGRDGRDDGRDGRRDGPPREMRTAEHAPRRNGRDRPGGRPGEGGAERPGGRPGAPGGRRGGPPGRAGRRRR
jgi:hypothetical protein